MTTAGPASRWPPSTFRPSCVSPSWPSTALGDAREEIDALNVYPVPDGDTGTNLFLTLEAARTALVDAVGGDAVESPAPADLRIALAAFARGALLGARGNSGVIFSSLVGALCKRLAEAGPDDRSRAGLRRRAGAGHAGRLLRRRRAGRGHDPVGGAGRLGGCRRGRTGPRAPAGPRRAGGRRCRPRGAGPHPGPAAGAGGRGCRRRGWPRALRRARRGGDRRHGPPPRGRPRARWGPTRSRRRCRRAT